MAELATLHRTRLQGVAMSNMIAQTKLREIVGDRNFFTNGDPNSVEGIKYDFRLGKRFLKASFRVPISFDELSATEKANARVEPGEVVFVMTEERIKLPNDVAIMLSPKRKIAHEGVLVLGGLTVDPNYDGHLLLGLYNFSSEPFRLDPGRKIIAGIFYRLSESEIEPFPRPQTSITDFPEELIKLIGAYQPINVKSISEQIKTLEFELGTIKKELNDGKTWQGDFRKDMTSIKENLERMENILKTEITERQNQGKDISHKLEIEIAKTGVRRAIFGSIIAFLLIIISGAIGAFIKWKFFP
jgi:deoxycytidine triphosphate deaminase